LRNKLCVRCVVPVSQNKEHRPKLTPLAKIRHMLLMRPMDRCNHCQQELIEIDNRGERLAGCLSCNLWSVAGEKLWMALSKEDLNALELHYLRQQMPSPRSS
jgi:hypothetical protein